MLVAGVASPLCRQEGCYLIAAAGLVTEAGAAKVEWSVTNLCSTATTSTMSPNNTTHPTTISDFCKEEYVRLYTIVRVKSEVVGLIGPGWCAL